MDDGSSDSSLGVIKSFADRIRWETSPNGGGGNAARNRLLQLAQGEWLQYLDADDFLLPPKIGEQLAFVALEPTRQPIGFRPGHPPILLAHPWLPGVNNS